MSLTFNLISRDAETRDQATVTDFLAGTLADGPLARWLDPDPATRHATIRDHVDATVQDALAHGVVRVAEENSVVIAATVWSFPEAPRPAGEELRGTGARTGSAVSATGGRARHEVLDRLMRERRPLRPHHHLALIGVRADRRRQELGGYLLIGHHALLHGTGVPAYVCAHDNASRALFLRHRYTDMGDPIVLPDGIVIQPMWREPVTADPYP